MSEHHSARVADARLRTLARQARGLESVPALSDEARAAVARSSRMLEAAADAGAVYGLTTGVGALRAVDLDPADVADQALRLWRSHAGGLGPELSDDEARATMLTRLAQLSGGASGVSLELTDALERAVQSGCVPVLRAYGSVGTGDLGVLAQLALALVGQGAWRTAAPTPATVTAADALPFLSSNAMTVGLGALAHHDLRGLLVATERVAALSFLALRGSAQALDPRVFAGRDPATAAAAERLRTLLEGARHGGERIQDPFALRTLPQVHGVALAALDALGAALHDELAAPRENPMPVDGVALHHGGFLTQRLAAASDALRQAVVGVATLSQSRLAALVDPRLTELPAFLAHGPAGSSGLMILEYVAADVLARAQVAGVPASSIRTSVSTGLEEVASHSTQSVAAARALALLVPDLLACELLAAARALRLAPERLAGESVAAELAGTALGALGDLPMEDRVLGPELQAARGVILHWAGA